MSSLFLGLRIGRCSQYEKSSLIRMPADKYTETRAEKALVSAGLILDAARAYVA